MLFTFSVSFIYIFGLIWLLNFVPWDKLLALGVLPFLLAELFKILILNDLYCSFKKWIIYLGDLLDRILCKVLLCILNV